MLCIKTIKNLSSIESKELCNLLGINDMQSSDIIIYEKTDTEIVGIIVLTQNKDCKKTCVNYLFVKDNFRNLGIGKKVLDMAYKIGSYPLQVCLHADDPLITYYEKRGFIKVPLESNENEITLTYSAAK